MKYIYLTIALCAVSSSAFAVQRDMSLSIEETMRQPDTTQIQNNAGTGFDDSVPLDPAMAKQMRDIQQRNGAMDSGIPSTGNNMISNAPIPPAPSAPGFAMRRNFMAGFCDSSQSCQSAEHNNICERFRQAPVEVQRILDRAANCEYSAARNDGMDAECDGLDASRLDLLKQYWQDENTSYTLLFLPDMVLNASAKCGPTGARR